MLGQLYHYNEKKEKKLLCETDETFFKLLVLQTNIYHCICEIIRSMMNVKTIFVCLYPLKVTSSVTLDAGEFFMASFK